MGLFKSKERKAKDLILQAREEAETIRATAEDEVKRAIARAASVAQRDVEGKFQEAVINATHGEFREQVRKLYEAIGTQIGRSGLPSHIVVNVLHLVLDSAIREQRVAFDIDS